MNGVWHAGYISQREEPRVAHFKYDAARFRMYCEPLDLSDPDDAARLRRGPRSAKRANAAAAPTKTKPVAKKPAARKPAARKPPAKARAKKSTATKAKKPAGAAPKRPKTAHKNKAAEAKHDVAGAASAEERLSNMMELFVVCNRFVVHWMTENAENQKVVWPVNGGVSSSHEPCCGAPFWDARPPIVSRTISDRVWF